MARDKYYNKLVKFDSEYFRDTLASTQITCNEEELCRVLATWAYDGDFYVDSCGWEMLTKIETHFSKRVREQVLYNLFHRNHDT